MRRNRICQAQHCFKLHVARRAPLKLPGALACRALAVAVKVTEDRVLLPGRGGEVHLPLGVLPAREPGGGSWTLTNFYEMF